MAQHSCISKMTGFWFCYGCLIIGILYYVSYDVFVSELNEAVVELEPTEMDLLQGENVTFVSDNSTDDKMFEHTGPLVDIFDFCPFKPPDPWHESILKYMDDKYGFMKVSDMTWIFIGENTVVQDCKPNETLASVTDLVNGTVVKKKGKEKFTCKGRCVEYAGDNKYDLSNWSNIEEKSFSCDFVETECKLGNVVNRYIHMQVAEKLSKPPDTLNPQKNPSVLLLVIDSVASTQIIRALPRTINFLMHGLEAVEFRRLNKVGSNSRPNAFPLLLGRTTEAIVKKVMNVPTIEPDLSYNDYCNRYLDDIPYIPLEYKKAGYQMFGAEDYTASILNYPNCKGTKERQFEHSYRPLHSRLRDDKELKNIHLSGACRLLHSIMLDYLSKFVKSNKGWPKFALTALPRTINFLMHGLKAVEFRKLNKVGSNSRPNGFALLLGKTTEAIVKNVMNIPTIKADLSDKVYCSRYLDDIPYIPIEYKKAGYKMFGAEDAGGSILHYYKCKGTKERQFEHSFRPYHNRVFADAQLEKIHLNGSCRQVHSNMLDYLSKFLNSYKGKSKFALTWLTWLAHDDTKDLYSGDYDFLITTLSSSSVIMDHVLALRHKLSSE
ncbi:hypothetical protein Q1695_003249 [Nippostrongylus brasiliensis]|nr:hypothetical protein Q1695_003249 [Nippostrongylus brasiliensis]